MDKIKELSEQISNELARLYVEKHQEVVVTIYAGIFEINITERGEYYYD